MKKVFTCPQEQMPQRYDVLNECDAYSSFWSGNSSGCAATDGMIYSSGNSEGTGIRDQHRRVTSIVDAVSIERPVRFIYDKGAGGNRIFERKVVTWDEAWDIATQDEKLVLIQLMGLK